MILNFAKVLIGSLAQIACGWRLWQDNPPQKSFRIGKQISIRLQADEGSTCYIPDEILL